MARPLHSCNVATCQSVFHEAKQLKRHMKRHDKPYKCRTCQKPFGSSFDQTRHEATRHGVGPRKYACRINNCLFTTNRTDLLKLHKKKDHQNEEEEEEASRRAMVSLSSSPAPSSIPLQSDRIEWYNKAKEGDTATLQKLLDTNGAALEDLADDGSTALHCAASSGNEVGVAFLLQKGANLEAMNKKFRTPLHEAILGKHHQIVKQLLREGASLYSLWMTSKCLVQSDSVEAFTACTEFLGPVTLRDELKRKILYLASQSKAGELLPALLSPEHNQSNQPNDPDATLRLVEGRDDLSWAKRPERDLIYTPIHHAVAKGQLDVVKKLVESQFKVNVSCSRGMPLHVAAGCSNVAIVEYLLRQPTVQVDSLNPHDGTTPLHSAARKGQIGSAKLLLGHPATRINAVDRRQRTALYHAAMAGHLEIVNLLLGQKQISLGAPNHTLLRHVAFEGHWPIVRTLLDYQSRQGGNKAATASPAAQSQLSSSQLVEELSRHPDFQDMNTMDMFGRFLVVAANRNDTDLIRYLLNHGEVVVDPNYSDYGQTPLLSTTRRGYLASVQELLKHPNIDVNIRWGNSTPLRIAKLWGRSEIAALLIAHGAIDDDTEPQPSTRDEQASSSPNLLAPQNREENSPGHSLGESWSESPEVRMEDVDWSDNEIDQQVDMN